MLYRIEHRYNENGTDTDKSFKKKYYFCYLFTLIYFLFK